MVNRKPGYYRVKMPYHGDRIAYWNGYGFEVKLTPGAWYDYSEDEMITIDETPIQVIAPVPRRLLCHVRSLITNPDFWVLIALIIFALIVSKK